MRGGVVVVDPHAYLTGRGDVPLQRPFAGSVIYEMRRRHRHPSSASPGTARTYLGLIEKIPYLEELGVTAVELLPVQQFDVQDAAPSGRTLGL